MTSIRFSFHLQLQPLLISFRAISENSSNFDPVIAEIIFIPVAPLLALS